MDWASLILIVGVVATPIALLFSFYLLAQAIIDRTVLEKTGLNGPLKALSNTAIIQESLRTLKLLSMFVLFILAYFSGPGEQIVFRRLLILLVVLLIAAGSVYGGYARRSLLNLLMAGEVEKQDLRKRPG